MNIYINKKREKIKTITLNVMVFKRDRSGNTYHATDLYINNSLMHTTGKCYGSSDSDAKRCVMDSLKDKDRKLYKLLMGLNLETKYGNNPFYYDILREKGIRLLILSNIVPATKINEYLKIRGVS